MATLNSLNGRTLFFCIKAIENYLNFAGNPFYNIAINKLSLIISIGVSNTVADFFSLFLLYFYAETLILYTTK